MTIGRNDPCHCGSGKKYKKCCQDKDTAKTHAALEKQWSAAEKEFQKRKDEAEKDVSSGTAAPAFKPASGAGTEKPQRHSTLPTPKFNMPRRAGGG